MMDPIVAEERKKVFAVLRDELFKRQNINSDNFDKSILAYSTGGLGLSLAFLKDFVPVTRATASWLLYASWALFVIAVVLTMLSFVVSQEGLKAQNKLNERYYLQLDDSALNEKNLLADLTEWLNYSSGVSFVAGILLTTLFVSFNLERAAIVSESKTQTAPLGALIPSIQQVVQPTQGRGTSVPGIQAVPQPQQQQPQTVAQPVASSAPAAPSSTVGAKP